MDLTPNERAQTAVRYLAEKKGLKQFQIGMKLGYTNKSAFSVVLNGKKRLPGKFADKLSEVFPEINPDYIRGESDEMLVEIKKEEPAPSQSQQQPSGIYLPLELVQMFTDMSATVRSQQETIRLLVGEKTQAAI